MSDIILGWDPTGWNRWNYAAVIEQVAITGLHLEPWSVGRSVAAGTGVWLVLLGAHGPGVIGHGVVLSDQPGQPEQPEQPEEPTHPESAPNPDQPEFTVQVAFDALLPLGDHVPAEVLTRAMPGVAWDITEIAGVELGPGDAAAIRSVWTAFGPVPETDPTHPVPGTYPEEALTRVPANRYERDAEARRACIAHRGSSCAACGFSFELAYGELGKDFTDVHHVVPVAQLGGGYQLDPLTDLVPLCANCHAMAHYGVSTPRTEVELRRAIANAGYLRGSTVSPEELDAVQAAREILGRE